jgi:hypothetical protein
MTRKEAIAVGAIFYVSKVCPRHPELAGQRRAAQGNCHACIVERMQRHRNKNRKAYNRRYRKWRQDVKAGKRTTRKYRRASEVVT